jgi:predicted hydrocarbon binding protein
MHGLIFLELKKYVETKLGTDAWRSLLKEAGLGAKFFLPSETYPDDEAVALVTTASKITGQPAGAILEDFGEFIVPDLIDAYRPFIKKQWKTLDMIEHTEANIHRAVRLRNPGAAPPELKVRRASPTEVVITYSSLRKMCSLAKGIARGVAKHYGERITIDEPACMHRGAPSCQISVKLS